MENKLAVGKKIVLAIGKMVTLPIDHKLDIDAHGIITEINGRLVTIQVISEVLSMTFNRDFFTYRIQD